MELEAFTKKLFKKEEILSLKTIRSGYETRSKIVVFVPIAKAVEVMKAMAKAGAGEIGKYKYCSFNTSGSGSYLPSSKAKPFKGRKNELIYVDEIKLEMECAPEKLENVLDAMISSHPYEEVAYEIYEFKKRSNNPSILLLTLKKNLLLQDVIGRINKKIELTGKPASKKIKTILIYDENININKVLSVKVERDADIQPGNNNSFHIILN